MPRAIGFRSSPNEVCFAIVNQNENSDEILVVDKIKLPEALETPERLKYLRNVMLDILLEYNVELACIRVTEPLSRNQSIERIGVEAVIQELLASSPVKKYCIGRISRISAKLGIPSNEFSDYVNGNREYEAFKIKDWKHFNTHQREALLSAICSLKL